MKLTVLVGPLLWGACCSPASGQPRIFTELKEYDFYFLQLWNIAHSIVELPELTDKVLKQIVKYCKHPSHPVCISFGDFYIEPSDRKLEQLSSFLQRHGDKAAKIFQTKFVVYNDQTGKLFAPYLPLHLFNIARYDPLVDWKLIPKALHDHVENAIKEESHSFDVLQSSHEICKDIQIIEPVGHNEIKRQTQLTDPIDRIIGLMILSPALLVEGGSDAVLGLFTEESESLNDVERELKSMMLEFSQQAVIHDAFEKLQGLLDRISTMILEDNPKRTLAIIIRFLVQLNTVGKLNEDELVRLMVRYVKKTWTRTVSSVFSFKFALQLSQLVF